MDSLAKDLLKVATGAEAAAARLDEPSIETQIDRLRKACGKVGKAWSGGWLGYHSRVYTQDLTPVAPGAFFDTEWGSMDMMSNRTVGEWAEYDYNHLVEIIQDMADNPDIGAIRDISRDVRKKFAELKDDVVPLMAALARSGDDFVKELHKTIDDLKSHFPGQDYIKYRMGRSQFVSRDARAISDGPQSPPHLAIEAQIFEITTHSAQCRELAALARRAAKYVQTLEQASAIGMGNMASKVFIGHGRSSAWRDLKDLLADRLGLDVVEFNSASPAGIATTDRLGELLKESAFAFLVMTAEDEHADGTRHARENVIHEAGLFQARLGFRKAIVVLEQGCEEFSNITGLGQIRFPKGNIEAKSEEIRQVLEREGLL